jgi:hypothetical protein
MGLFRKRTAAPAEPAARPRFGPGRRLASERDLRTCVTTISGVLDVHAPTKYRYMPTLYDAAVIWHGEKPLPEEAWSCSYGADDIFVFVLWPAGPGTEIGLFPLGGSEESLNTPLIGQWKQADSSLRSIGRFEPRQLTLLPPELDRRYFEETLRLAGKPVTDANIAIFGEQVAMQFTLKAYQFIAGIGRDERSAALRGSARVDWRHLPPSACAQGPRRLGLPGGPVHPGPPVEGTRHPPRGGSRRDLRSRNLATHVSGSFRTGKAGVAQLVPGRLGQPGSGCGALEDLIEPRGRQRPATPWPLSTTNARSVTEVRGRSASM